MDRKEFSIKLREAMTNLAEPLPMEPELWAAGCDTGTARFVARMLRQQGYYLVNPDHIDWVDIERFRGELAKGQSIYEDAGGFFTRAISALFRIKTSPVISYRQAADAMLAERNKERGE